MMSLAVEQTTTETIDGIARCARYAFGPNRLHLCGPDMNREVLAYLDAGLVDQGLNNILRRFQTLFPYLQVIAETNNIKDPFDDRVVEAYWLGNELLDVIPARTFYRHLTDNLALKKKYASKDFDHLGQKLRQGALMHHSFHVLNVWRRTGHDETEHTWRSFDQCRISWAKVIEIDGPILRVKRQPLTPRNGKLTLGQAKIEKVYRQLETATVLDHIKVADIITLHWSIPCEVINCRQLNNLIKYTRYAITLANQTI